MIETMLSVTQDPGVLVVGVCVFLTVLMLTFAAAGSIRVRADVRRRAAGVAGDTIALGGGADRGRLNSGSKSTARLVAYVEKAFAQVDRNRSRVLRLKLVQAGYFGHQAVAWFFVARFTLAGALTGVALMATPVLFPNVTVQNLWLAAACGGGAGYLAPGVHLSRRSTRRQIQHRCGFPDFMDLMVVCAEAGLSMEAAIDRVGRELLESYPSLSLNLYLTSLEVRAGKSLGEALEQLADRLGIEEARSLATLLQQSEELGSSLSHSLRVYSDEMRHKRLSRAEEKAYALPAKLVIPLGLFIFPVLIVVLMLPVFIRMSGAGF